MTLQEKILALQGEVGAIAKDSKNPFYKSAYFDINKLVEVLKPLLQKHKIIIIQPTRVIDGKNVLETQIIDTESEQFMNSSIVIPDNIEPQKMGSAITYLRRYTLQSLLFLQAEDDDANVASGRVYKLTGQETKDPQYAPRKAVKAPQKPVGSDIEPF